jgi:uncharacterized protein with ATP-grasp and redox domains
LDPYRSKKTAGLAPVHQGLEGLHKTLNSLDALQEKLAFLLLMTVQGNKADLSLFSVSSGDRSLPADISALQSQLLVDDSTKTAEFLLSIKGESPRLDIHLDNGGLELASDLSLAEFLIKEKIAGEVFLHAKPYPTYVSDATQPDIFEMISFMSRSSDACTQASAKRLLGYLDMERISIRDHYFWVSPLNSCSMPAELKADLKQSSLILVKGDANYRRWVEDRHWPFNTPLQDLLAYIPAPVCLLRIFKSNCAAGVPEAAWKEVEKLDSEWLYDGNWGVIQFVQKHGDSSASAPNQSAY